MRQFFFYTSFCSLLFLNLLGCKDDASDTEEPCVGEKNILISCITIYDPVCGCDGNVYSNDCIAEAEGIFRWEAGTCN